MEKAERKGTEKKSGIHDAASTTSPPASLPSSNKPGGTLSGSSRQIPNTSVSGSERTEKGTKGVGGSAAGSSSFSPSRSDRRENDGKVSGGAVVIAQHKRFSIPENESPSPPGSSTTVTLTNTSASSSGAPSVAGTALNSSSSGSGDGSGAGHYTFLAAAGGRDDMGGSSSSNYGGPMMRYPYPQSSGGQLASRYPFENNPSEFFTSGRQPLPLHHPQPPGAYESMSSGGTGRFNHPPTNPSRFPVAIKLLVSNNVAGSIIGRQGQTISEFQSRSMARIKLSQSGDYFPGTHDRVCLVQGEPNNIKTALRLLLERMHILQEQEMASSNTVNNATNMGNVSGSSSDDVASGNISGSRNLPVRPDDTRGASAGGGSTTGNTSAYQEDDFGGPSTSNAASVMSSFSLQQPSFVVRLLVPSSSCGMIIGKAGSNIKFLEETTGVVSVRLSPKDHNAAPMSTLVNPGPGVGMVPFNENMGLALGHGPPASAPSSSVNVVPASPSGASIAGAAAAAAAASAERALTITGSSLESCLQCTYMVFDGMISHPDVSRYLNMTTSYSRKTLPTGHPAAPRIHQAPIMPLAPPHAAPNTAPLQMPPITPPTPNPSDMFAAVNSNAMSSGNSGAAALGFGADATAPTTQNMMFSSHTGTGSLMQPSLLTPTSISDMYDVSTLHQHQYAPSQQVQPQLHSRHAFRPSEQHKTDGSPSSGGNEGAASPQNNGRSLSPRRTLSLPEISEGGGDHEQSDGLSTYNIPTSSNSISQHADMTFAPQLVPTAFPLPAVNLGDRPLAYTSVPGVTPSLDEFDSLHHVQGGIPHSSSSPDLFGSQLESHPMSYTPVHDMMSGDNSITKPPTANTALPSVGTETPGIPSNQSYLIPVAPTCLGLNAFQAQIAVPDSMIGSILGRAGRTLNELQLMSGTRIWISQRGEFIPGTRNRVVTVRGPTAQSVWQTQLLIGQRVALSPTTTNSAGAMPGAPGNTSSNNGTSKVSNSNSANANSVSTTTNASSTDDQASNKFSKQT